MAAKLDPLMAFKKEILLKVIKPKLIDLAYENKGSFQNVTDFYEQFRQIYKVEVSDQAIRNWMKALGISLEQSFTFVDQTLGDEMKIQYTSAANREGFEPVSNTHEFPREPTDEDIDNLFDNE
jgi:hypothetical protein